MKISRETTALSKKARKDSRALRDLKKGRKTTWQALPA